jgi:phenylacetate-CoA ligase
MDTKKELRPSFPEVILNRLRVLWPSLIDLIQFAFLIPREILLKAVCVSYGTFLWVFRYLPPSYLAWSSRIWERRAFYHAAYRVPAYGKFLVQQGLSNKEIPETDKESYIRAFPIEERCLDGKLFLKNVMADESSGSTGTPYDWVRSRREREESHLTISYFATYCFGREPLFTINAFSMGAWATGINMGMALQKNGSVKNTGPDIQKIFHTLEFFGPGHTYLITGYPPFLKRLMDEAQDRGFPLEKFRLYALVGGEGMSEGLRDYLLKRFQKVFSGYGATDIEIGLAGETPLSVAIRRLALANPAVRKALFGDDPRLPMLFQYNPLMHHIKVNSRSELLFTVTRRSLLSPRVRYNVHDQGGVMRFDEMKKVLSGLGFELDRLVESRACGPLNLPFIWVFGRSDTTVSVMGANIYPEDLEHCLYAEPELARITRSFCLSVSESAQGGVRPCFIFEIEGEPNPELNLRFQQSILGHMIKLNADFREAWKEYPQALLPDIRLYAPGQGPFAQDQGKIKQVRLLKKK